MLHLRTVVVGLLAVAAGALIQPENVLAACDPSNTGNGNDNTITCDDSHDAEGADVSGAWGEDTITVNGGTVGTLSGDGSNDLLTVNGGSVGTVSGGNQNDTILLNGGSVGAVDGGGFGDSITLNGTTVTGAIKGGTGDDTIELKAGSAASVNGEADSDHIILEGTAEISGAISGGDGEDIIELNSGQAASVDGSTSADEITLDGATITGNIGGGTLGDTITLKSGSAGSVSGDDGFDTITLSGATIAGAITGNSGEDTINLNSGSTASVHGGADADQITLEGDAEIAGAIVGAGGDDVIALNSGSAGSVNGGADADQITLAGATIGGEITGGSGDDTITLRSGSAASVTGEDGDDEITLTGKAVISGVVAGGANADTLWLNGGAAGAVDAGTGFDMVTLNGATITGEITGGTGDDTIEILAGSAASVTGDDGEDTILLDGTAVIAGVIAGGADHDSITLTAGQAGSVDGGDGADTITLDGATVDGEIAGGGADDTIKLLAGSAASVNGGSSGDNIVLDGATISGEITGDDGSDEIVLKSGAAGSVRGHSGMDSITLDGAAITGAIAGDVGDDNIRLVSGSVGSVDGGAGSDTVDIDAASFDLDGLEISGGSDSELPDVSLDTLNFNDLWSGVVEGGKITGFETININGGTVSFSDGALSVGSGDRQGLMVKESGTLDASAGLVLDGDLVLTTETTLLMGGGSTAGVTVRDDLTSGGLIDMQGSTTQVGDLLVVEGDYVAKTGARLAQDLDLRSGLADRLDVTGTLTGETEIAFNIVDMGGIQSDIVVVGAGTDHGAQFTSSDLPAGAGLATYRLMQNDAGDWVVRSALASDRAGSSFGSYADLLVGMVTLPGQWMDWPADAAGGCGLLPATQAGGGNGHVASSGTASGVGADAAYSGGGDIAVANISTGFGCSQRGLGANGDVAVQFGLTAGLLGGTATLGDGEQLALSGLSLGIAGAVEFGGLKVTGAYRHERYDVAATGADLVGGRQDFDGSGDLVSIAAAYGLALGDGLVVTPSVGLDYRRLGFEGFDVSAGAVTIDEIAQLTARGELRGDWQLRDAANGGTIALFAALGLEAPAADGTRTVLATGAGDIALESAGAGGMGYAHAGVRFGDSTGMAGGYVAARGWSGATRSGYGVSGGYSVSLR